MPCLNEVETLRSCIREAQSCVDRSGVSGETVIGNNGSRDGSQDIAGEIEARVVQYLDSKACEEVKEESGREKPVHARSLPSSPFEDHRRYPI